MNLEIFDTNHLSKTYFKMALPVMLGLVVTLIYNLADTFFIGQTGNTVLVASVSLCSPVFTALMAFGNIYGQGGSSLISRLLGENQKTAVQQVSSFCFYVAILTGIVLGVFMLFFHQGLLYAIGANEETFDFARDYFIILAIGAPAIILSFIHQNLLRCEGMATVSMIGTIAGAILNIILDPILISHFHMNASGAAIATVLGYVFSDLFYLQAVLKYSQWLSVKIKDFRISINQLKQILGIGVTAAIANLMQSLCVIVMNQFLLPYGSDKIAAMGIVLKVNMIAQLIITGFSFGAVPVFGYHYGRKAIDQLKELFTFCLKFLSALSIVLTLFVFLMAPSLLQMMMNHPSVINEGALMLRYQVITTLCVAVVLVMICLFQVMGKVLPSIMLSISRQGVIFVIILFVLVQLYGYQGLLLSQAAADIVSIFLAIVLYIKYFKVE